MTRWPASPHALPGPDTLGPGRRRADSAHATALARLARTAPPDLTRWLPTDEWCGIRTTSDVTA